MEIVQSIMTNNPCYKKGESIEVKGLVLHSVGCPQPSAESFIKRFDNPNENNVCVHAFIDGNTGTVYQTLPWERRGWHAGRGEKGSANNTHIGVEMCEPGCIQYTSGAAFTCSDPETANAVVKRTYDAAVELFAFLCQQFQLDPLQDGVVISHEEGHRRGIASGHADPTHLWKGLNTAYTMDGFRHDVSCAMNPTANGNEQPMTAEQPEPTNPTSEPEDPATETTEPAVQTSEPSDSMQESTDQTRIQAGDVVQIAGDAVYYTGAEIKDFVKADQWIVESVSGDRAVIDKNVSNTHAIHSPINVKYLTVVSKGNSDQPEPMDISAEGVEFIKKFEGCRLEAYQCAAGAWTIGYGHTHGVQEGDTLPSEEDASALLTEDLKEYTGYVNTYMAQGIIGFPLNQNQFDALTSFCYNRGCGRLKELVNGKDAAAVAEDMLSYVLVNEEVNAGLLRRRQEEREMFLR